jgi:hypothetical protein
MIKIIFNYLRLVLYFYDTVLSCNFIDLFLDKFNITDEFRENGR